MRDEIEQMTCAETRLEQEHKAEMDDRETKLGEWEEEKRQRLQRIRELNASTKVSNLNSMNNCILKI